MHCDTHHKACQCREAEFEQWRRDADRFRYLYEKASEMLCQCKDEKHALEQRLKEQG